MDDMRPGPKYFFDQPSTGLRYTGTKSSADRLPLHLRYIRLISEDESIDEEDDEEAAEAEGEELKTRAKCPATRASHDQAVMNQNVIVEQKRSHGEATSRAEEHELTAPLLLHELGQMLEQCARSAPNLPCRELRNVLSRGWRELAESARRSAAREGDALPAGGSRERLDEAPREKFSRGRKAVRKKPKVNKNRVEKAAVDTLSLKDKQKGSSDRNPHLSQSPRTVSFSISSETCDEQGWIVQTKDAAVGDPRWQDVCRQVVDRLQLARTAIKEQSAQLKEQGFTKAVFLHHYGDNTDVTVKQKRMDIKSHPFVLRCGHPPVAIMMQKDSSLQKLHYRINDGTSFIYYPSGRIAVCQSHSGLPQGGFYTNVFADDPDCPILATFTAFGHGSITHTLSGTVMVVWDQHGGMMCDPNGTKTSEWTWACGTKPIFIQLTELISVRVLNSTSAILWFKGHQKTIQLPVISLPKVSGEVKQLEMDSNQRTQCTDQELRGLQKRIRRTVNSWLEYYRVATGICCPEAQRMPCYHQQTVVTWQVQTDSRPSQSSAGTEPLCSEQPPRGSIEQQKITQHMSSPVGIAQLDLQNCSEESRFKTSGKLKKEDLQYVTVSGPLRVHSNIKLTPVLIPKRSESPRPAPVPIATPSILPIPCPSLLRDTLLGNRRRGLCCCSAHHMPLLTDLEYDAFMLSQASRCKQVLVVCVTPSTMENVLEDLYERTNRNRSKPCTQCNMDSFRLVRYEGSHNTLLYHRHGVVPGMFLMYLEGKLLFADYMFEGQDSSAKELQKQIIKTRGAYRQGHCLPPDFSFRLPPAQQSAMSSTPKRDFLVQRKIPLSTLTLSTEKNLHQVQTCTPTPGFNVTL